MARGGGEVGEKREETVGGGEKKGSDTRVPDPRLVPPGGDTGKSLTGTFVRDGVRDLGGCRGAQPPALGPRSGKFCRFETLEGHFLVKIEVLALEQPPGGPCKIVVFPQDHPVITWNSAT